MDPCSIVIGAFCLGLIDSPDFEKETQSFPVIEIGSREFDLELIFIDNIQSFDRDKTNVHCVDGNCTYYTYECDQHAVTGEYCTFELRPNNGCGHVMIRANSKGLTLPKDWRSQIYFLTNYRTGRNIPLSDFTLYNSKNTFEDYPIKTRQRPHPFYEQCKRD